jgi:endonuclease/exonuclease/phosphatase family metal-dependent hydrolase
VATYNVENYLLMPRHVGGKLRASAGKPESEKSAVARMIVGIHPDILALMEIGDSAQLSDLRRRLAKEGEIYPESEYLEGSDASRHLVLLSKHPIVERHSRGDLTLKVGELPLHSPRGILDVTVEPRPGYRLRILCVHLKAKLEVAEYNQEDLRQAEAEALRKQIRGILKENPATRLIVMGDFNDTKNGPAMRTITGKPEWPDSLDPLPLTDERGELWTEYWSGADIYSRIDYIMVGKKLGREIDQASSGIARPSYWHEASDHCPLYLTIRPPKET